MVFAVDALTRTLAIVGAVSGLTGAAIALAAYLRDRPRLTVTSGSGGTVFRASLREDEDEEPSARVFVANHGRQPITIVEAGLTTLPEASLARRLLAWGLFILLLPIWILVSLASKAWSAIRPSRANVGILLPEKLDMRARFLMGFGRVWLAPELDREPLLLTPGQVKILVFPWPEDVRKAKRPWQMANAIFAFATDSRGRTVTDTHQAFPSYS
jgi:hypothetical protein